MNIEAGKQIKWFLTNIKIVSESSCKEKDIVI